MPCMVGGEFFSIFLLTASLKELNENCMLRNPELLLAPCCNSWCTSSEKKQDYQVVKSPDYEQIKICQPSVFLT